MTGPHVLVVEDDPSVRGLIGTLLTSEGYDVATAPDGSAGLHEVAVQRPDVILLDLVMPDLGGFRVLEELAGHGDLAGIPVVVVTGRDDAVPALRERLGPDSVVLKPFSVEELLDRVARATGGAAAPPEAAGP